MAASSGASKWTRARLLRAGESQTVQFLIIPSDLTGAFQVTSSVLRSHAMTTPEGSQPWIHNDLRRTALYTIKSDASSMAGTDVPGSFLPTKSPPTSASEVNSPILMPGALKDSDRSIAQADKQVRLWIV